MRDKSIRIILLVPAVILLVPAVAMLFTDEVKWDVGSFIFAYALMTGVGFAYRLVTRRVDTIAYRLGAGLALATAFILVWITAAVQIIGDENPANMMYGGVLLIGLLGASLARFAAAGMARALLATALAQALVPVIALVAWPANFSPGVGPVFALNAFFVVLFAGAALLFRHAARTQAGSGREVLV